MNVDNKVEVFVYRDSEDRLIATTLEPKAQVGQFAFLKVVSINKAGAFLDWGLEKDLFVPFKEQRFKMFEGFSYAVYLYIDNITDRIVASSKLNKFFVTDPIELEAGQEIETTIYEETKLGYNCLIDQKYKGLIYANEVFTKLKEGETVKAYVKTIRPDKLIDVSLQRSGFKNVLSSTDVILNYLVDHEGFLDLTDKSSPDEIAERFAMSKATFKKSLGVLYRQRKVRLESDGVYLVKEG